jgi:hypothetical protein
MSKLSIRMNRTRQHRHSFGEAQWNYISTMDDTKPPLLEERTDGVVASSTMYVTDTFPVRMKALRGDGG